MQELLRDFDFQELTHYSNEEMILLLKLAGSISADLGMNQYKPLEMIYRSRLSDYPEVNNIKNIIDDAIRVCLKAGTITWITKEGVAYQTNNYIKPFKSEQEMRSAIHHY